MTDPKVGPFSSAGVPVDTVRKKSPRRIAICALIALVVCSGVLTSFIWAARRARETYRCMECSSNLKCLFLGLENFSDAQGSLPPAYLCDKQGKPIHSWQSFLKPYIGYYDWLETYSWKEPWDGPNNRKLVSFSDSGFQCPTAKMRCRTTVDYVAVVGPDTMWPGRERVKLPSEKDANRDTILLIEMPDSDYNSREPRSPTVEEFLERIKSPTGKGIRCIHPKGLAYITVGGEVRWFPPSTDPETIRRLLKRDPSCRVVPLEKWMTDIEHSEKKSDPR